MASIKHNHWRRSLLGQAGRGLPTFFGRAAYYILPLRLVKIFSNEQEMRTNRAQNASNKRRTSEGEAEGCKMAMWGLQ